MRLLNATKQWFVQNIERTSAFITWFFVGGSAFYFLTLKYSLFHWRPLLSLGIFIALAVCFLIATRHDGTLLRWRVLLFWAMYGLAVVSQFMLPYAYIAIFVVIWSAVLPYYLPWNKCVLYSVPLAIPTVLVQSLFWQEQQAVLTGALFWTFNLFAMMMSNTAIREANAKEAASALNRQLLSTQHLVKQAITQDERLRIARNIHDVVGHHLTALTINLQVASRKSHIAQCDEVKQHIDQCHAIAKLLLSDVREAISDIRENAAINFEDAVKSLISDLPRPNVQLNITSDLVLSNVRIADALLRCIQEGVTNVIRHTQSQDFVISLDKSAHSYTLRMQDLQGQLTTPVVAGNGLTGMAERVKALNGKMGMHFNQKGFLIDICIPEQE